MIVLMRTSTGDNWGNVLIDLLPQNPPRSTCDPNNPAPCGSWIAVPFYATFVILVSFILLNIFMAVIIDAYEKLQEMVDWHLSPQHLDDFAWAWAEYDDGTGTISPEDFLHVLLRLLPPLGLGPHATEAEVEALAASIDVPLDGKGRLHFHRTLYELVRKSCQAELPTGALRARLDQIYKSMFHKVDKGSKADLTKSFSHVVSSALSAHRQRIQEESHQP